MPIGCDGTLQALHDKDGVWYATVDPDASIETDVDAVFEFLAKLLLNPLVLE